MKVTFRGQVGPDHPAYKRGFVFYNPPRKKTATPDIDSKTHESPSTMDIANALIEGLNEAYEDEQKNSLIKLELRMMGKPKSLN